MPRTVADSSEGNRRPLRFGVLCTGTTFQAWQAACLERLSALGSVEPALLIVDEDSTATSIWQRVRSLRFRNLLWDAFSLLFVGRGSRATRPVDMATSLAHVPTISCRAVKRGKFSQYFGKDDIAEIKKHNLDFILRFGFGIIRGEALKSARFGVWSFHHGDEEKYRGTPAGFWEIYKGDNVTGAILQRLTDRLDGGVVLRRGFFKTNETSYTRNRDTILLESAGWPAQVCVDIQNGNTGCLEASPSKTTAPVLHAPNNLQMILFVLKLLGHFIRGMYNMLLFYPQWGVGVVDQPIHAFLTPGNRPPVRWLHAPNRSRFIADPFAIQREDGLHILFEDFDQRTSKGRISKARMTQDCLTESEVVIDEPFHMSYPYLFEDKGEIYCIPETYQAREVRLYRANSFPGSWVKVATLIEGVAAVDSTVFQHEGRWWLLATDKETGAGLKLKVWHAGDLLGPWKPHANNPVKVDVRSARPAGTPFVHDGHLYRPCQDSSRTYGGRILINRIVRLSPTEFEEEQAAVVEPYKDGPYPNCLHTLSAAGDVTVIDGARNLFVGRSWVVLMQEAKLILASLSRSR